VNELRSDRTVKVSKEPSLLAIDSLLEAAAIDVSTWTSHLGVVPSTRFVRLNVGFPTGPVSVWHQPPYIEEVDGIKGTASIKSAVFASLQHFACASRNRRFAVRLELDPVHRGGLVGLFGDRRLCCRAVYLNCAATRCLSLLDDNYDP